MKWAARRGLCTIIQKKPINKKAKGLDYEELESMVNDNIKILLEKIETNKIIGRVGNLFDINDKEP